MSWKNPKIPTEQETVLNTGMMEYVKYAGKIQYQLAMYKDFILYTIIKFLIPLVLFVVMLVYKLI